MEMDLQPSSDTGFMCLVYNLHVGEQESGVFCELRPLFFFVNSLNKTERKLNSWESNL